MRLGINSLLLVVGTVLITLSAGLDVLYITKTKKEQECLTAYLEYEAMNIRSKKRNITERIKTSIDFERENRRNDYQSFTAINGKSLQEVEKAILTLYPGVNNMDSLPYMNVDIANARKLMLTSKNKEIKRFYENLLFIPVLEALASTVDHDSGGGLSGWELYRPITEDSTYIGAWFYGDGHSKHAFRINGQYYESSYLDTYILPKSDTLNIETLYIVNQGIFIDTTINEQTIVFKEGRWQNTMDK